MGPSPRRVGILVLALALAALPAVAAIYYVELASGTTFESRYRPVEASWDPGLILFLTDVGNWIAVPREDIVKVEIDTERKGFGLVINNTTIELGMTANDAPVPGEEGQALDPTSRLLNFLQQQQTQQPVYSMDQFVEPGETGGIPVGFFTGTTPPMGVSPQEPQPPPQ